MAGGEDRKEGEIANKGKHTLVSMHSKPRTEPEMLQAVWAAGQREPRAVRVRSARRERERWEAPAVFAATQVPVFPSQRFEAQRALPGLVPNISRRESWRRQKPYRRRIRRRKGLRCRWFPSHRTSRWTCRTGRGSRAIRGRSSRGCRGSPGFH